MKFEQKEKLLFSLNESIKLLKEQIEIISSENLINDKPKLYKNIGDVLHWIYDCLERVNENDLNQQQKDYISAFRGAANVQKHAVSLDQFDSFINCTRFPFTFPAIFSDTPSLTWMALNENIIDNKNQIKKYNIILSGKDIVLTIEEIQRIIIMKL